MLWCNGELQYYLHHRHLRVSQQKVQYTNALSVGRMSLPVRVAVTNEYNFRHPTALPCPPALETNKYC